MPPRKTKEAAMPRSPADPASLVELLSKGVLLTNDRIQAAMDDAVQRGRMTRTDAEELVRALLEAGRKQTEELRRMLRDGGRARRAAGPAGLPIRRYDDLTAAQIIGRVGDLSAAQLREVRDYERRHGNRKSVLAAVEKQLDGS